MLSSLSDPFEQTYALNVSGFPFVDLIFQMTPFFHCSDSLLSISHISYIFFVRAIEYFQIYLASP